MTIHTFLQLSVDAAVKMQRNDGSMPPGHNGPYHHGETPVRKTAHWLVSFLKVFSLTGERRYRTAAEQAALFLLRYENRPEKAAFLCLTEPGAHPSNGLIGQAGVIEALAEASSVLDMPQCYEVAEEVFLFHPWDEKKGYWHKLHIDGRKDTFDYTFNHQLWFAAAAGMLKETPVAIDRAGVFLRHIEDKMLLYKNGIIKHLNPYIIGRVADLLKAPAKVLYFYGLHRKYLYQKSVGYHGFNLYALALLKQSLPDNPVWASGIIEKTASPLFRDQFKKEIGESKYAYPYNPAGIEIAMFLQTFYPDKDPDIQFWLESQFKKTWDSQQHMMSKNAYDTATNAARMYEAARLSDVELKMEKNLQSH